MPNDDGLTIDADGTARCTWACGGGDLYLRYHDAEWGMPAADDRRLFEKLCLEGFQSGLSWLTILRKRENFRQAFADFDIDAVAAFGEKDVERLVVDAGIIRHRGKIVSAINNAARAIELRREFGTLAAYFWTWEPNAEDRPARVTKAAVSAMPTTPASAAMSKDLKRRGWTFVGPTTAYAFMQAMGLVNDHLEGCATRPIVERARGKFKRPSTMPSRKQ